MSGPERQSHVPWYHACWHRYIPGKQKEADLQMVSGFETTSLLLLYVAILTWLCDLQMVSGFETSSLLLYVALLTWLCDLMMCVCRAGLL